MTTVYEDDEISQSASNDGYAGYGMRMNLRGRQKKQTSQDKGNAPRLRGRMLDSAKFLEDFDPEKSSRERRKLTRKTSVIPTPAKSTVPYDEDGKLRDTYEDYCDCTDTTCVGCFCPCTPCGSTKCGPICRTNRKFFFEVIEYDGKDKIIKNKLCERIEHQLKNK